MSVDAVGFLPPLDKTETLTSPADFSVKQSDFADTLSEALSETNTALNKSDQALRHLAAGDGANLHSTMITLEEAKLQFQLSEQIRNKLLESYQQIMREQI